MAARDVLEEGELEIAPGRVVRLYSVEHRRCSNAVAGCDPAELARELNAQDSELARRLAARLGRLDLPQDNDRALVAAAVRRGHWRGLGATWGVSREADALWAAAAFILKARGAAHPNELPPSPE